MHCDPSLVSHASSLVRGVIQMKLSRCSVLRDLWLAQAWEEAGPDGSQRWPLEEEPGDWPFQVASRHLACLEFPKSLFGPIVHQQQGSVCLLAPSQPLLPILPLISHNTDGSGSTLAAFYHPLPSSSAMSSSPSGKPPSLPLLVHRF